MSSDKPQTFAVSLVLQADGWKLYHMYPGNEMQTVPYPVSIGEALAIGKAATEQVVNRIGSQKSPYDIVREGSISLRTSIEAEIQARQAGVQAAQVALTEAQNKVNEVPALQQRLVELEKA